MSKYNKYCDLYIYIIILLITTLLILQLSLNRYIESTIQLINTTLKMLEHYCKNKTVLFVRKKNTKRKSKKKGKKK